MVDWLRPTPPPYLERSTHFGTDGQTTLCHSFLHFFISLTGKTQGAHPFPFTHSKKLVSPSRVSLDSILWGPHGQMDGCHLLPTTDLQKDLYFLRENSIWDIWMIYFGLFCFCFSHSLHFLDFFFFPRIENSSETVLIPTRHNTPHTAINTGA